MKDALVSSLKSDPELAKTPVVKDRLITTAEALSRKLENIVFQDAADSIVLREKLTGLLDVAIKQGLRPAD